MVLSDKNIEMFQDIYKKHFGKEISKADAKEQGGKLLQLMSLIYRSKTPKEIQSKTKTDFTKVK